VDVRQNEDFHAVRLLRQRDLQQIAGVKIGSGSITSRIPPPPISQVFTRAGTVLMFHRGFEHLLDRRARRLAQFLDPRLPRSGTLLDIGSGTGHNARRLRTAERSIVEADVVDIHTTGPGPVIVDDQRLPFGDSVFTGALLMFVLHYAPDPVRLLREAARVGSGRVWVLQSSCTGIVGRGLWSTRDAFTGRLAFQCARWCGYVPSPHCPLQPSEYFTRGRLEQVYREAGLRISNTSRLDGIGSWTMRDLDELVRESS
jgi:SAM-dependent methyltransferase